MVPATQMTRENGMPIATYRLGTQERGFAGRCALSIIVAPFTQSRGKSQGPRGPPAFRAVKRSVSDDLLPNGDVVDDEQHVAQSGADGLGEAAYVQRKTKMLIYQ